MAMHNCEYVATASTAFMEDDYAKVEKAIEAAKKGMAQHSIALYLANGSS